MSSFNRIIRNEMCRFNALVANTKGNVLILFALTLPVVILSMGAAVDFSRGSDAQVKVQSALDAGVLAGAQSLSAGETNHEKVKAIAKAAFDANIEANNHLFETKPVATFSVDAKKGEFEGRAKGRFAHAFNVLGAERASDVSTYSQAGFSSIDIELSMMLDVTGSMRGQKIADLKDAAKSVVDLLIGKNATPSTKNTTRIALVPYAASINAGPYANVSTNGASQSCVTERTGRNAATDADPGTDPVGTSAIAYCPNAEVTALSTDAGVLIDEINAFSAGGFTAGHIGVAWTYYTLSPEWRSVWPGSASPAAFGAGDTLKVALLMTDGLFNTYYDGVSSPFGSMSAQAKSNSMTKRLCKAMRDDGIKVYTVAYKAPSDAEAMLRDCAEASENYFETNTGDELITAFKQIVADIRNLRLKR